MEVLDVAKAAIPDADVIEVNRSQLRQNQSALLRRARGRKVLLVKANQPEDEKVVVDREYFDQMRQRLNGLLETLEISMDRKLFNRILAAADTLEADLRAGRLHSLDDAFAEE